jgi:hypothetical protein
MASLKHFGLDELTQPASPEKWFTKSTPVRTCIESIEHIEFEEPIAKANAGFPKEDYEVDAA